LGEVRKVRVSGIFSSPSWLVPVVLQMRCKCGGDITLDAVKGAVAFCSKCHAQYRVKSLGSIEVEVNYG